MLHDLMGDHVLVGFVLLVSAVFTLIMASFAGEFLKSTGFYAKKTVKNWVEAENLKAQNIDSLKITGADKKSSWQ